VRGCWAEQPGSTAGANLCSLLECLPLSRSVSALDDVARQEEGIRLQQDNGTAEEKDGK
jgi:hypothetical protein